METALGAGGTGRGAAGALRGAAGQLKDLEKRQKSRATRAQRDALDRALVDLAGFYRDVLASRAAARRSPRCTPTPPSSAAGGRPQVEPPRGRCAGWRRCWRAATAIEANVKPRIAVESMMLALWQG